MNIKTIQKDNLTIAYVTSADLLITDSSSALDLMAAVQYETDSTRIILNKDSICEDFFRLSTCLAGEILQKYMNYGIKLAIIGEYSGYTSKPLQDFIYESNHGRDLFFVPTLDSAVACLSRV